MSVLILGCEGEGKEIKEAPFSFCLSLSLKIKAGSVHWEILLRNFVPSLKKTTTKMRLCGEYMCVCARMYVFSNSFLREVAP